MRYVFFFLSITLGTLSNHSIAQTLESAISFGSAHQDFASQIAKAPNGDMYVVGGSTNLTDFNPAGTQFNIQAPGIDKSNAYVAKYHADMTVSWVVSLGESGWDEAHQLILDDSLNVYIMGRVDGDVDFDPSDSVHILDVDYGSYFLAKYGDDGTFKGVTQVPSVNPTEIGYKLLKDDLGYIYAYSGAFISKYTTNLDVLWTEEIGGYPELLNNSSITCIKNFKHSSHIPVPDEAHEIILEQYDLTFGVSLGETVLAHTDGVINNGFIKQTKNNDLLIYGKYWGTLKFYGGGDTVEIENYTPTTTGSGYESREFICRYAEDGNLLWAKGFEDIGPNPNILETDEQGHIYALGRLHYSANFDPVSPIVHTAVGQFSAYIAKYDSAFNYLSMSQFLGAHPYIYDFKLYEDTALICGAFYEPIDVDLTSSEEWLTTNGFDDAYMIRYSDFDIVGHPVSVDEIVTETARFDVYSNRVTGEIQIHINPTLNNVGEHTVAIYDIKGQLLTSVQSDQNKIELDLSAYPKATYIVRVENKNWSASKKMIKE